MSSTAYRSWLPWYDRTGAWSWLRAGVFTLGCLPALWMSYKWFGGKLSPKPVTDILRESGDWAIRFIAITLAVSPLRALLRWNGAIAVRRMLGLFALFYACVHVTFYLIDQHFIVWRIVLELVLRNYLTIGFVALVILAMMGWTSRDSAVRALGVQEWQRLHRWVYTAAVLAVLHFFMQVRIKAYEPSLLAGVLVLLGGYRLLQKRRKDVPFWQLGLLSVFAAAATALVEAGYYTISMNAPLQVILKANFDFSFEIRPAWWVLMTGCVLLLVKLTGAMRSRRMIPAAVGVPAE